MPDEFYDEEMSRKQEALAATSDMQAQRRAILAAMALKPGEVVLDVRAGNGIMAREMLDVVGPSGAVTGLDAAAPMVAMARALCPGGQFIQGDTADLPFADASFDVVTAAQLICFLPDPDQTLRELHRVLRPGGRVVVLDKDWGSLVWNSNNPDLMARASDIYTSLYADAHVPRTLSRRLEAAGFNVTVRDTLTVLNWTPGPDNYAALTTSFLESIAAASEDFSEADWNAWVADQKEVTEAGEYMFSLNRYIFSAMRDGYANVRAAPFSGVNELIGDYRNSFAMSPAKDLAREGKVHFSSLYVSGGGDYGAFGAGLLYGWSEADDRPEFKVVTGVSTGALTAPLAFIGNSRDEELKQIFTDIKPDDIFVPSLLSGIFGGEALADTAPLRSIISQVADADLIDDVAREHRKGRRLL